MCSRQMDIQNENEIQLFSKWMNYRGYDNFTDLCADFCQILHHIHDYSNYRVDGQKCVLKFGTMNKIRMFISWMTTKMTDFTIELYAEHLLTLTRCQFNKFRQAKMIRMNDMSKSPPLEATTHMTTFSGHTKRSMASESQIVLNNLKMVQKGMHQHTPSSRVTSTMIPFRNRPWQSSKHKDSLLIQTLTLMMEINMTSSSLKEKLLCVSCTGYLSPDR